MSAVRHRARVRVCARARVGVWACVCAYAQVVTIPWFVWLLNALVNLLPLVLSDEVAVLMGACDGMDTFVGRGREWMAAVVKGGARGPALAAPAPTAPRS
jgi:hypothetical protein